MAVLCVRRVAAVTVSRVSHVAPLRGAPAPSAGAPQSGRHRGGAHQEPIAYLSEEDLRALVEEAHGGTIGCSRTCSKRVSNVSD